MGLVFTTGFPADMPERDDGVMPFNTASFDPLYQQDRAPTLGSEIQVTNLGPDLWNMKFSTPSIYCDDALEYLAWLHSLRGGARFFKAWHPLLKYPRNYPRGFDGLVRHSGGAFDGSAAISDFGEQLDTVTFEDLPHGLVFKRGDMFSYRFGSRQYLHRIMAPVISDTLGHATVTIEPTLALSFTTSPSVIASFVKPWCLASYDPSSLSGPFTEGGFGSVTFQALQSYSQI